MSLISQGHLSLTQEPGVCAVGSTYESRYLDVSPDPEKALGLLEKAAIFYPPAKNFEVIEIRAGIRISPKEGYRPICRQLDAKTWVFTGLGSRGMLYHALYGKQLARELSL
jgi:glycine/D-amino acid oxidase-like deaminating enzyme